MGVIGVELFVTRDGLVVNEIAPRVHNSGHWTEAACLIDQFEQHVRAICGWPLGDGARHSDAVMTNLLGSEADAAPGMTGARVHLYSVQEVRRYFIGNGNLPGPDAKAAVQRRCPVMSCPVGGMRRSAPAARSIRAACR